MREAIQAIRPALRFCGSVLMVSGLLALADVAVTLAWQEPITSLLAERQQARLADELEEALAASRASLKGKPSRRELAAIAARYRRGLRPGRAAGRIELPGLDRSYVFVEGTDTASLRKGPGHYPKTPLPGERGTVGIAGHRTTYMAPFRTIDRLRRGDRVVVKMPYGRFAYRVEGTRVVEPSDVWVIRRVGHDRLVLSACHPPFSASKRIVVFARLAS